MSLVGPRPELPEIVARYEPWQHRRHLTPPGITGWWQVNRDGVHLMHQATELDVFYLEHWSVALDFRIMASTVGIVLRGVGAF
jgi:lipopolysaccharide/colanic/teichoic acid biosynthesis glycosyltransferase